jgi:hypothetical protein
MHFFQKFIMRLPEVVTKNFQCVSLLKLLESYQSLMLFKAYYFNHLLIVI